MGKRMWSVLLAVLIVFSVSATGASAAELPFVDVPDTAWYKGAVTYAYENGLFKGNTATEFAPDSPMTRAMFVQVLANKTGNYKKEDFSGGSSFADVNSSVWYAAPIEWAYQAGLANGTGNNRFSPEQYVNREEMAVFLYKYAQKTGNDTSLDENAASKYADFGAVSSWAREAMKWASKHGVIKGNEKGNVMPKDRAKRCEVAQVFANAKDVLILDSVEVEKPDPKPEPEPEGGLTKAVVDDISEQMSVIATYADELVNNAMNLCYTNAQRYQLSGKYSDYVEFIDSLDFYIELAVQFKYLMRDLIIDAQDYEELSAFTAKLNEGVLSLVDITSGDFEGRLPRDTFVNALNTFAVVTNDYSDAVGALVEAHNIFVPIRDQVG